MRAPCRVLLLASLGGVAACASRDAGTNQATLAARYARFDERRANRAFRAVMRGAFYPSRTMAYVAAGHLPWYRPNRPLTWR
jgi:hypothetical protein